MMTPHQSSAHGPRILFGNGFDAPLWAAVFAADKGRAGRNKVQAILPGSQVIFATTAGNEASLRIGSGEWVLRRQEALVARHFDPAPFRLRGEDEEVLIIGFRLPVLAALLEPFRPGLLDPVRRTVFGAERSLSSILPLRTARVAELVESMRRPPVGGAALPFWYEGHLKAWLACACFEEAPVEPREFFCSKQKRLADERIETAKAILKARIDEALNLQDLAEAAGCSPSYLSRSFSAATGLTMTQYHRKLRIERAARLLAEGRCNVSEAAVEVGYQSLSHFSKAFRTVMGCAPSSYAA